jgi:flagellar biosynthesis protein FliR
MLSGLVASMTILSVSAGTCSQISASATVHGVAMITTSALTIAAPTVLVMRPADASGSRTP